MKRTFSYSFEPVHASPVKGSTVELTTEDIEHAGIWEVLQTPGATFGSWSLLDALLEPTGPGTLFVFKEPLGQAREVKVALSGLFGRFVARAYLERYFGLSVFVHIARGSIVLDRRRRVRVVKLSRGDLPDWLAATDKLAALTVAEAKGCHDAAGPSKALGRAWVQANRIEVRAGRRRLTVKRIAIATRWGAKVGGASIPMLSVRDPEDPGDATSNDENAAFIGLLRIHIANLIGPLGHIELAQSLRALAAGPTEMSEKESIARARSVLDAASVREVVGTAGGIGIDGLIGGYVNRAGPLATSAVSVADQETLARLGLRPVFVGVERSMIQAAIDGHIKEVRQRVPKQSEHGQGARRDRAGGWIVPLGEDIKVV